MKLNIVGDIVQNPGGLRTIERHTDSKNRNLSEQASISPPTEIISLSVLLTQRNVHTSDRLSCQWGPFPLTLLLYSKGCGEGAESPHPNLIGGSCRRQGSRALPSSAFIVL